MTRDDLYGYYRRYYVPNNATLVIVGDVDTDEALRRVEHHFGGIPAGAAPQRVRTVEPEQTGERRVDDPQGRDDGVPEGRLSRAGGRPTRGFFPLLVLDAVLTGAKGLNLWSSFRVPPPQRSARLYRALVERGLASRVSGALLPTEHPFLYTVSATATDGTSLAAVEAALLEALDRVAQRRHHRRGADQGEGAAARAARLRQRQRHEHRAPARILRDDRQRRRVHRSAGDDRRGHARGGRRRGRDDARTRPIAPSAGSIRRRR